MAKRPTWHKYTKEQRREAVRRLDSETKSAVATDLGIARTTLNKWIEEFGGIMPPDNPPASRVGTIKDFVSRVRSVLWGVDKTQYEHWLSRVEFFEGQGYSLSEAQVRAAKEFPACRPFFREYDIKHLDRDPGSHPDILYFGDEKRVREVVCHNQDMSYREALRWAATAAGMHLRTGQEVYECPCDTAYYLYQCAIGDPKDFMTKLGTMENREDAEDMLERSTRKSTERSVAEIDKWLSEVEEKVTHGENEEVANLFFKVAPQRWSEEDEDTSND
jgi:hypothetical protein